MAEKSRDKGGKSFLMSTPVTQKHIQIHLVSHIMLQIQIQLQIQIGRIDVVVGGTGS